MTRRAYERVFLYLGGLMLSGQMFFILEYTWSNDLHSASSYAALAIAIPVIFAAVGRATGFRWSCTVASAIYMVFVIGQILILPLFPATPKLGPVYHPVTHFVPVAFPVLLIVPGLVLDLLWQRMTTWRPWQIAAVSGVVFVAVMVAVEWPFASFLLSKAAENRFFGGNYFDYTTRSDSEEMLRVFFHPSSGMELWTGLAKASVWGAISTWFGLKFGGWMRTVQR